MNTKKPINSNSTPRLLSILPQDFRIVNDKTSNGYKFINLLYGVEIDNARSTIRENYDISLLNKMDLSQPLSFYEVLLDVNPTGAYIVGSGGIQIKITDKSEFYEGDPTRIVYDSFDSLSGLVDNEASGALVGLEYFRLDDRGSGYYILNLNVDQEDAYLSGIFTTFKVFLDNAGDRLYTSGFNPGISTQDYSTQRVDDLVEPEDSGYLINKYPLTRTVQDESGFYHTIDHYEPYLGFTRDKDNVVVPVTNYLGDSYFDSQGNKIYYRTAYNNPNGYNNYNVIRKPLLRVPISGSLKVYDMDNLDSSGNAIEIPSSGKIVYRLSEYVGYDSTVPYGRGFGEEIEGSGTTPLFTTSWDYQKDGGYLDDGTYSWVEGTGSITNLIKMTNPFSRYICEYDYKKYSKANYVTSLNSTPYLRLDDGNPIYSIENLSGNITEVPYQWSRSPDLGVNRFKLLTFDGWDVRPYSQISRIDFNVLVNILSYQKIENFFTVNSDKTYAGFSDNFIPDIDDSRDFILKCYLSSSGVASGTIESDLSGSGNDLTFYSTAGNVAYRIPYNMGYGKKLLYASGDMYYNLSGVSFLYDNTFFGFGFRTKTEGSYTLLDLAESGLCVKVSIETNGSISVAAGEEIYYTSEKINWNDSDKELIVQYNEFDPSPSFPTFAIYFREEDNIFKKFGFKTKSAWIKEGDELTPSGTYIHVYKNSSIEANYFSIYYKV